MVRIAQFNHPEGAGIYGRPGDQLFPADGGTAETYEAEVNITEAGADWGRIFRPVSPAAAERMADLMERAARNPHVGYSQGETRYTFGNALRDAGNDPDRIETDVNGDCSSGTAAVANGAGLHVRPEMTTYTEKADLMASREFVLIEDELRILPELYRRGDVLWRQGHTAIVIDNGGAVRDTVITMRTTGRLHQRLAASALSASIGEIPAGIAIRAEAPYQGPDNWTIVEYNGRRSWASLKWLVPADPDDIVRVTGWRVNVRSAPSVTGTVLEEARFGDKYVRSGQPDRQDDRGIWWYSVSLKHWPGWVGYISTRYAEVFEV